MLAKNDLLVDITEQLALAEPGWEAVVQRLKQSSLFLEGDYDETALASHLSEIHLRVSLEHICELFGSRVRFDPIEDRGYTPHYTFIYDKGRLIVEKPPTWGEGARDYAEYDQVLLVDNLPVLFEIKIKKYKGAGKTSSMGLQGRKRPKRRRVIGGRVTHPSSGSGVIGYMQENRINYPIDPLREYFETQDIGYVLVISNDQIFFQSPLQQRFREQNGILVPFYTDRKTYHDVEVARIRREHNL